MINSSKIVRYLKSHKRGLSILSFMVLTLVVLCTVIFRDAVETKSTAPVDRHEHAQLRLEKLNNLLEDMDTTKQSLSEPTQLYQRAKYYSEQATLMSILDFPSAAVNEKHHAAITACDEILNRFPKVQHTSTLAAELWLKESLPVMTSHDAYLTRVQTFKDQVDTGIGRNLVSALLEVSYQLHSSLNASQNDYELAKKLLGIAMEDQWYPGDKKAFPSYHQALIDQGTVSLKLGNIDEAQKLHDLQLALNPTYFPNIRAQLGRNIDRAQKASSHS